MNLDRLLETSRADQRNQMRRLVHEQVRYRSRIYTVIEAMGDGDRFGLFLQEVATGHIPMTLVVSGDDLRGVQLP